ncbi:MAG: beta-1,3-glucanase family protein [Spirochaetales bacterium]|nr:beta-1,3-glucanase family protein [Spirochaetales bacterium]
MKRGMLFLISMMFFWACTMDMETDSTAESSSSTDHPVRAVEMGEDGEILQVVKDDEGDLTFSVTYYESKSYVQLFVERSDVQYLVPEISDRESIDDDAYTYSYTESGDDYEDDDTVEFRFYSYGEAGQIYSPGPDESDWSEGYIYSEISDGTDDSIDSDDDSDENYYSLETVYIEPVGDDDARFSIRLSEQKTHVYLFARCNEVQDYVVIDLQDTGEVDNDDGTYTYESTRDSDYKEGDLLEARFYTYSSDSGQVYYPGSGDDDWTSYTYGDEVVYGSEDEDTGDTTTDDDTDDDSEDDSEDDSTSVDLIDLDTDMEMTFQFSNSTDEYSDDEIYLIIMALNSDSDWCYLQPDGTMVVVGEEDDSEEWYYCLGDIEGFQVPSSISSGRCYVSYEEPVILSTVLDANDDIGIVQPNLADSGDENQEIYFEWFEFTVGDNAYWGNTTQVDQYCFSYTKSLYNDDLDLVKEVGIEEGRDDIFDAFKSITPESFQVLVQDSFRILAPCKAEGGFSNDDTYGDYMDDYVDEVWEFLGGEHVVLDHPLGRFVSEIIDDDSETLEFYLYDDEETDFSEENREGGPYEITAQPTNEEAFEGSGVLASGDTYELCIEAWICAALNRHNATEYDGTIGGYKVANWNDRDTYYPEPYDDNAANHYSRFWHEYSVDGLAYGFCYDDVNDQSTLLYTTDPRAVVIELFWN